MFLFENHCLPGRLSISLFRIGFTLLGLALGLGFDNVLQVGLELGLG